MNTTHQTCDHPSVFGPVILLHALQAVNSSTPAAACPACNWYGRAYAEDGCPQCGAAVEDFTQETIESVARNYGIDLHELRDAMEIDRI